MSLFGYQENWRKEKGNWSCSSCPWRGVSESCPRSCGLLVHELDQSPQRPWNSVAINAVILVDLCAWAWLIVSLIFFQLLCLVPEKIDETRKGNWIDQRKNHTLSLHPPPLDLCLVPKKIEETSQRLGWFDVGIRILIWCWFNVGRLITPNFNFHQSHFSIIISAYNK